MERKLKLKNEIFWQLFLICIFMLSSGILNAQGFGSGVNTAATLPITVHSNVYIGRGPGVNASSTAVGLLALNGNAAGDLNTAIGCSTLIVSNSSYNTAIGSHVLKANTSGQYNTAGGAQSMQANITGITNTAFGFKTLQGNTAGSANTAIGNAALHWLIGAAGSADSNTAIGYGANYLLSSGKVNVAVGYNAINVLQNGNGNIGIGALSLSGLGSGDRNVAIGYNATVTNLGNDQLSIQNVIYGRDMQAGLTHGNISMGSVPAPIAAGGTMTGTNVFARLRLYGNNQGVGSSSSIPSLQLGYVPDYTGPLPVTNQGTTNKYLFVDAQGVVCQASLPTTTTGITNACTGASKIGFVPRNADAAGNVTCSQITDEGNTVQIGTGVVSSLTYAGGGAVALPGGAPNAIAGVTPLRLFVNGWAQSLGFISTSDERLKKDFKKIDHSLDKISKLNGYTYNWNKEFKTNRALDENRQAGFLAQEVEKVLPEAVIINSDGIYGINYNAIMPLLSEGIKEQQTEIEAQQLKIENLQLKVDELERKLNQLTPGDVKVKLNSLEVTPNPVTGISVVSYKLENSSAPSFLVISDLQGKILKQVSLAKNQQQGQVQVNRKDLPGGMYVFAIVSGNAEVQSKKVLVSAAE